MGNSLTKWALWDESKPFDEMVNRYGFVDSGVMPTGDWHLPPAIATVPDEIYVSSVAGQSFSRQLLDVLPLAWSERVVFVNTPKTACGIRVAYDHVAQLGVDRWLAMVAAHRLFAGELLVVGCGTAITLDRVTRQGEHEGGLIAPGFKLMEAALNQTAEIEFNYDKFEAVLGRNTAQCASLGIAYAIAGLIEYVYNHVYSERQADVHCVLAGGAAREVERFLNLQYTLVEDLVLQGLAILAGSKS